MPLYAAICRSLERKSLIFLGLGFFFASRQALLGREAHREQSPLANLRGESRANSERSESANPSRRAIRLAISSPV